MAEPKAVPLSASGSQEVGFKVNWLRVDVDSDRAQVERDALDDRRISSLLTVIWAVEGST